MKLAKRLIGLTLIAILIGVTVYNTWFSNAENSNETSGEGIFVQPEGVDIDTDEIEVGEKAPNFKLETLDGKEVELADFRGQKVFLNFWATWCSPCREEMPAMQKISDEYGEDVVILGVNATAQETNTDNVSSFVNELNLSFPILLDKTGEVNVRYQVLGLPTTYFINTKGEVQFPKHSGPLTYEDMEQKINELD